MYTNCVWVCVCVCMCGKELNIINFHYLKNWIKRLLYT